MSRVLVVGKNDLVVCWRNLFAALVLKKINLHGSGLWSQAWEQLQAARAVIESRNPLYFDADGRMFGAQA